MPGNIRLRRPLALPMALSESEALSELRFIAARNEVFRSYIGQGYHDTLTPGVIQRNILENPGWYTAYTPYQAEIAQGRLEALINFQTMVCDLTGMDISNASLLDEGTAAAEAMNTCHAARGAQGKKQAFFVSENVPPADDCGRADARAAAEHRGGRRRPRDGGRSGKSSSARWSNIRLPTARSTTTPGSRTRCMLPARCSSRRPIRWRCACSSRPVKWGADVAVGSTQRFGVPLGYGGPHAAYFAVKDEFKRIDARPSGRRFQGQQRQTRAIA